MLSDWLAWQETLNARGIELGLERVHRVLERMQLLEPPFRVLTVAGTNGKGSVASCAASILHAAGRTTGLYLSPHIRRYNERISIDGVEAGDDALCAAFEAVDRARGGAALTYFEFGTLAALEIFRRREVDVAVLEVGLGGRLDAVNAIDPDVSVVVSVGIDHVDWLGGDIDSIAREKAGIFRKHRPAIYGSKDVPSAIRGEARRIGADLKVAGEDFSLERNEASWTWRDGTAVIASLPPPPLAGEHQLANAAAAIAGVRALDAGIDAGAVRRGVAATRLPGRLQSLGGSPEILLDVGHNPDSAAHIAAYLRSRPAPTHVVLAMLADKDAPGFVRELAPQVSHWHLATLTGDRGQDAQSLAERLSLAGLELACDLHAGVAEAAGCAISSAPPAGRVLVAGSFHTVGDFLVYFDNAAPGTARGVK